MLQVNEDALICDLAETYGIYDWRALPLYTVATLAAGLRPTSRIMMEINGTVATFEESLLAGIFDNTSYLLWLNTKDGQKGRRRPKSMLSALVDGEKEQEIKTYASGKDFEKDRARILEKIRGQENGD